MKEFVLGFATFALCGMAAMIVIALCLPNSSKYFQSDKQLFDVVEERGDTKIIRDIETNCQYIQTRHYMIARSDANGEHICSLDQ